MEMNRLTVDFSREVGRIKPMNAVNGGPIEFRGIGNYDDLRELCIPYMRNHDVAFYPHYGGEHTVDVHNIFPDFDADENDPTSYDFTYTDHYVNAVGKVGSKVFYRLGSKIEHGPKKYGTVPPRDYAKWARICEHIIRHYTEGWADGFYKDIEYWEIWNEPDCSGVDGQKNPCWQGSVAEFCEFFCIALSHLKKCFPKLKIGGPAFCSPKSWMADALFSAMKEKGLKLDFYSFHRYTTDPASFADCARGGLEVLQKYGMEDAELILNEWNYVSGWEGDATTKSTVTINSPKGASFDLAAMIAAEKSPLDQFAYYEIFPDSWNGLWNCYTNERQLPFYAFKMFGDISRLGTEVESVSDDERHVFVLGASGDGGKAIALTYYDNDDGAPARDVAIDICGTGYAQRAEFYIVNKNSVMERVRTDYVSERGTTLYLHLENYDLVYVKLEQLQG